MRPTARDVEILNLQLKALTAFRDRVCAPVSLLPLKGCGDNSCVVVRPSGAGTNGGCRCDEPRLRLALMQAKMLIQHQQAVIDSLK